MSFISSAQNVEIHSSTPPDRPHPVTNCRSKTMKARRIPLLFTKVIHTASGAICACTNQSAKPVNNPYQISRSMRWEASGIRTAFCARSVFHHDLDALQLISRNAAKSSPTIDSSQTTDSPSASIAGNHPCRISAYLTSEKCPSVLRGCDERGSEGVGNIKRDDLSRIHQAVLLCI
jgi:hypothetical protein